MECDPGITEPGIIIRPWLFLLLKEGCGRNSYNLEHPQVYTFTDLLSWHRHHDWGDLSLFVQVSSEEPVTHSYVQLTVKMWKSRTNWKGKHSRPQHWLDPDVLLSSPSFPGHQTLLSPHSYLEWGYFVSMFWVWSGDYVRNVLVSNRNKETLLVPPKRSAHLMLVMHA